MVCHQNTYHDNTTSTSSVRMYVRRHKCTVPLTILPFTEGRQVGVSAMVEAEGQLGLQGELLQLIGNSFALRAGGR